MFFPRLASVTVLGMYMLILLHKTSLGFCVGRMADLKNVCFQLLSGSVSLIPGSSDLTAFYAINLRHLQLTML